LASPCKPVIASGSEMLVVAIAGADVFLSVGGLTEVVSSSQNGRIIYRREARARVIGPNVPFILGLIKIKLHNV
jgi:hypothetical protein